MKKGLGRGLESLFNVYNDSEDSIEKQLSNIKPEGIKSEPEKPSAYVPTANVSHETEDAQEKIYELPIGEIDPNKDQPRKKFDETALRELALSIEQHGVIQPIVVVRKNNRYMIIAGERRWRASKLAGKKTIPAIVRDYDEMQTAEVAIIENLQRQDLNPMEEARAMKKLMDEFGWTQDIVAEKLGKSRPVISNTIRLLNLQPEVIEMIEAGKLSAGHARSLVIVENRDAQIKLAKKVAERKITVRELEKIVKKDRKPQNPKANQSIELKSLVGDMERVFRTKVQAIGNDQRGRLYLDYYSRDDLERIYELVEYLKSQKI